MFEAAMWTTNVKGVRVVAFVGTPARYSFVDSELSSRDLMAYRILSGVMQVDHDGGSRVEESASVGVIEAEPAVRAQTWGTFSAVFLTVPHLGGATSGRVNPEEPRLRAAIELARAFLLESLSGQELPERDARVMREILFVATDQALTSPLREKALSLIDWEHTNPLMTIESMAAELNVSRRHLYRSFQGSGATVGEVLQRRRMDTAVEWLTESTSATVSEIARESGFGSSDQFRRAFKRVYGVSPNAFREAHWAELAQQTPSPREV